MSIDAIAVSARLMAAFSGFYESHEPPLLGNVGSMVLLHRHGHQNDQQSRHIMHCCLFAVTLVAAGAIRAISLPMAAFSGFYESPGPPPSGNVHGIAPSHCHCYQNGQRRRYICSLLLPLLFDQNVAKRPCYGPFKLMLSYYVNQSNRCH